MDRMRGELGAGQALRRLATYLVPLWRIVLVAALLTTAYSALNLGYGALVREFLRLAEAQARSPSPDFRPLWHYIQISVLVIVGKTLLFVAMGYSWSLASQRLGLRLRNEVFAHLQRMSVRFFDVRRTGQLMSCLNSDVAQAASVVETIQDSLQAPLVVLGGVALLFYISWPLAIVSCTCLPLMALAISRATQRTVFYTNRLQRLRALMSDVAQETLSSMRVVKAFANEAYEVERYRERSEDIFKNVLRTVRLRLAMRLAIELLGAASIILVLVVGTYEMIHNSSRLDFGGIAWFLIVLQQVVAAARDFGGISVNLSAVAVGADRVFTLLDQQPDVREKPEALELREVRGRVEFDGVEFGYARDFPVLEGISFTMEPGEVVALVGPTGGGKTTIASLIPRFYDVTGGAVRIDGIDVRDVTLDSLRRQIGVVPQDTTLFAGSLRENIAYGRLNATEEEIIAAARLANAWEFIERLPGGLDTVIGERGVMLSGGQRQRIAIARAVLRNPRILILDEATSALDAHSEALIQDALQHLVRDRTTLVIAHRLSTIRNADRILVLRGGKVVEAGRHEELLARQGYYASLYATQLRGYEHSETGSRVAAGAAPAPTAEVAHEGSW